MRKKLNRKVKFKQFFPFYKDTAFDESGRLRSNLNVLIKREL
jgi:hypothetical protein